MRTSGQTLSTGTRSVDWIANPSLKAARRHGRIRLLKLRGPTLTLGSVFAVGGLYLYGTSVNYTFWYFVAASVNYVDIMARHC